MTFLLIACSNGVSQKLGVVVAESPDAAAKKLGAHIEGRMNKWDSLGAYYLKRGSQKEPLYILEHWAELETFPEEEIRRHKLKCVGKY